MCLDQHYPADVWTGAWVGMLNGAVLGFAARRCRREDEGKAAGASLSHPHSQLIATPVTPKRVKEELVGALDYYNYKDRCIFCHCDPDWSGEAIYGFGLMKGKDCHTPIPSWVRNDRILLLD